MKVNWSTVRLALLCLVLFPTVLNAWQGTDPKQKNSPKKTNTQTDPATSRKNKKGLTSAANTNGAGTVEAKGTNKSNSNVNASGNGSEDKAKSDAAVQLAKSKQELKDRVDTTLHDAHAAIGNTDNQLLQQKLKQLTSDGESLKQAIDSANSQQELTALDSKINQLTTDATAIIADAPSWTDNLTFSNVFSLLALLLSLWSVGGVIYLVITFRRQALDFAAWHLNAQRTEQDLRQSLKDNKEQVETVAANLSRVAQDLGLKIDSAKRSSEEAKKLASTRESQTNPEPLRAEPPFEVPAEPTFPSLVADYLSRLRPDQSTGVEADFRTNRLVAAAAETAPFVFIEDGDGSGAGIVLPKPRLLRSQEFSSYYKGYYYCSDPSAGEVYIIEPAVVFRDGTGWRLSQMGRMEIH